MRVVDTKAAGRWMPTIKERVEKLAEAKGWPQGSYGSFADFRPPTGGGSAGVGCLKTAARDIYAATAGRRI